MSLHEQLDKLVKAKGELNVSYEAGGGGMGLYWCATVGREWPFCSGGTLEGALKNLVSEHTRLEREALQKRITEIDASAQL